MKHQMTDELTEAWCRDGEAVASAGGASVHRLAFAGEASAYFRIWIVGVLLTVLTLGLYWGHATVRSRRYFYRNTTLAGMPFDYHGNPWHVLLWRVALVGVVALVVWAANLNVMRDALPFVVQEMDHFRGGLSALSMSVLIFCFFPLLALLVAPSAVFTACYASFYSKRFSFNESVRVCVKFYFTALPILFLAMVSFFLFVVASDSEWGYAGGFFSASPPLLMLVAISPWYARAYHGFAARHYSWGDVKGDFSRADIDSYITVIWGNLIILAVMSFGILAGTDGMIPHRKLSIPHLGDAIVFLVFFAFFLFYLNLTLEMLRFLFWDGVVLPDGGRVRRRFSLVEYGFYVVFVNFILVVFSAGLLYPWARIRRARFLAENMVVDIPPEVFARAVAENGRAAKK